MKKKTVCLFSCFLWLLLTGGILFGADLTEQEWEALRQAARGRLRRIIVNNDGCDYTNYPADKPFSREDLYAKMLSKARKCEIDTISYCPYCVGLQTTTLSKIAMPYMNSTPGATRNLHPEVSKMGTDSLKLAVEFARENHFEIFACLRVNDHHDQWYPEALSQFKKDHPELLFGTADHKPPYGSWTGFDFAQEAVQELFTGILEEFSANYDIDGLELDFNRAPTFFKTVAWGGVATDEERGIFTKLMRTVRRNTDRIGRQKKHYQMIAIRIPDSLDLCHDMGLDVRLWMKEGLVDLLIPGGDVGRLNTYADAVAMGHQYGVKVYPSVDTSWMKSVGIYSRNMQACYAGQTAGAMQAGADGIYYFNMFYVPKYLKAMRRSLEALRLVDKTYIPRQQNAPRFADSRKKHDKMVGRVGYHLMITPERPRKVLFEVGDDFSQPEVLAANPEISLYLLTKYTQQLLQVTMNGHELSCRKFDKGEYQFDVAPGLVHPGENTVEAKLSPKVEKGTEILLLDSVLDVYFAGKPDTRLVELATAQLGKPASEVCVRDGKLSCSADIDNGYQEGYWSITEAGNLHLDHNHPRNLYQTIRTKDGALCGATDGYLVAEWRVKPMPPVSSPKDNLFTVALQVMENSQDKSCNLLVFRHFQDHIETNSRMACEIGRGEFATVRAVVNLKTQKAVMHVNGNLRKGMTEPSSTGSPILYFGDGSRMTSGAAEVEYVRFWIMK